MRDMTIHAFLLILLRMTGVFDLSDIKLAMLETNGRVGVWSRTETAVKSGG